VLQPHPDVGRQSNDGPQATDARSIGTRPQRASVSDPKLAYVRLSDPILVTRAKAGDERALAALCERHAPRIEKLALHLLGDREDARDAAQESLAKLVVRVRQFRGESQFGTWLHRLVVNTCKDYAQARAIRRTEPLELDNRPARDGDPLAAVTGAETRQELGRCLAELPAAQATVVALKDAFDLGFSEISAVTGLPVGTAKCYAHRGRASLRDRLSA
jgi:RNA polymerase sigma-70 factor (ECF subfamily)